jgi:hypothetical protein
MNEMEATTTTDSAPTSSADIAGQVIGELEAADTGGSDAPGYIDAGSEAVEVKAEPVKAVLSPEEQEIETLLAEFGFKEAKKPDGREHYIPRSKVLKMIGSGLKRGQEKWTTEKGVFDGQVSELRAHLDAVRADVHGDPKTFLEKLAAVDPRYKAFLEAQPAPVQGKATPDDRPKPDVDLGNGAWTYSPDQNDRLIEWKARQLLDERLKPIEEREQSAKAERERAAFQDHAREQVRGLMAEAQTWPLFGQIAADNTYTPFQTEILTELKKDRETAEAAGRRPAMSLRQAYLEVYARHQEPDKIRERLLQEINAAPKSTAVVGGNPDGRASNKPRSTSDIVRQVIGTLEK